jgi:hypothetical protein|tara:strand:- start:4163 stop:4396 length:234 start_codon:yes stop_codon:yes gene_type:complete
MRYDRNDMLRSFLRSSAIDNETTLNLEELANINFSSNSNDILIESLKTLLIAHSNGDGEQVCFKKVNVKIQEMSKDL